MDDLEQLQRLVARTTARLDSWPGPRRGTAFLVTRTHALTCAHCLRPTGSTTWAQHVTLHFSLWKPGSEETTAEVVGEPDWDRDVAVLKLATGADEDVHPLALACNSARMLRWDAFAHPGQAGDAGAVLSGEVRDPHAYLPRQPALSAIQLHCDQPDTIRGASGGPVVVGDNIVGMLCEQLVAKATPGPYSDSEPGWQPTLHIAHAVSIGALEAYLRIACPEVHVLPPVFPPPRVEPPLKEITRDTQVNRLHYASEAVEFVGREQELADLRGFLAPRSESNIGFAWWLWTAHAGQGKSRLAFRLGTEARSHGWRCGFLLPTTPNSRGGTNGRSSSQHWWSLIT